MDLAQFLSDNPKICLLAVLMIAISIFSKGTKDGFMKFLVFLLLVFFCIVLVSFGIDLYIENPIFKPIFDGMLVGIKPAIPYITEAFKGSIAITIIGCIIYQFYIMIGSTKKEARKASKKATSLIDGLASLKDLFKK